MKKASALGRNELIDLTGLTVGEISAIVASIAELGEVEHAYVFGSRARGDWRDDSEIDLYVTYQETGTGAMDESLHVRAALRSVKRPKDILCSTERQFRTSKRDVGSIEYQVENEGLEIYGRN